MDAIVIAGGVPAPDEPLYPLTQGKPKALLDLEGKPMVQWVLDALNESRLVNHIVVIGLEPVNNLTSKKPLVFVPDQGSMVENLKGGIRKVREINPRAGKMLAVSSDIPGITGEMVDWLVEMVNQTDDDVYYCVIPREVMEQRYPNSRRSYTHLKDMEVCGGDMNAIDARLGDGNTDLWEKLTDARKNVVKQAALIGFSTLFLLLLRQATITSTVRRVSRKLGVKGRAIISPYAEIGMDIDKPHQLELVRLDLAARVAMGK
jgi:GTP:adenosylcobinamide-phosphate guanylyltransferase